MSAAATAASKPPAVATAVGPAASAAAALKAKKKDYTLATYAQFGMAGALSCSLTHTAVVPLDVVKTRLQTMPGKYKSMADGFRRIAAEEGTAMLLKGAGPTALGYFLQGAAKFGCNEYFKKQFTKAAGPVRAQEYRLPIWMGASACAEVIADLFLCPLEATRIRLVSNPSYARGLTDGLARLTRTEGLEGLYRGLPPLLLKQVPYTVAKFSVFEVVAERVYATAYPATPRDQLPTSTKLAISLGSGLAAGLAAALISQPADTVLSKINQERTDAGMLRAIATIVRRLGPRGLFLGLGARFAMVGTLTAGQFFVYDGCKQAMGVSPQQLAAKGF